jgi:hypothetical protein
MRQIGLCTVAAGITVIFIASGCGRDLGEAGATSRDPVQPLGRITMREVHVTSTEEIANLAVPSSDLMMGFHRGESEPKPPAGAFAVRLEYPALEEPLWAAIGMGAPFMGHANDDKTSSASKGVWIDANKDGKFDENEKLASATHGNRIVYGPVKTKGLTGEDAFYIVNFTDYYLHAAVPAKRLEATVEVDGKPVKIALLDGNLNGKYNDFGGHLYGSEGDFLGVDLNGNGRFDRLELTSMGMLTAEVVPLSKIRQMPDGNCYALNISDDGRMLELTLAEDVGTVTLEGANYVLLESSDLMMSLKLVDGKSTVPARGYERWMAVLSRPGEGGDWSAMFSSGWNGPGITIERGKTLDLKSGLPMTLGLEVEKDRQYEISLELKDREGHEVLDVSDPKGERPPPAELKILNASGATVHTEQFHYG